MTGRFGSARVDYRVSRTTRDTLVRKLKSERDTEILEAADR